MAICNVFTSSNECEALGLLATQPKQALINMRHFNLVSTQMFLMLITTFKKKNKKKHAHTPIINVVRGEEKRRNNTSTFLQLIYVILLH